MTYAADGIAAVFGGSFDPVTIAHERIIASAMEQLGAEKGIVIPCSDEYIRAHKGFEPMFDAASRLEMLRNAFEADARISIDTAEVTAASAEGRSLLTMRQLKKQNPGLRLIFVTGADKLTTLPRWGGGAFLEEFECAVCPRDGASLPEKLPPNVIALRPVTGTAGISAGKARRAAGAGGDVSGFVSAPVCEVIKKLLLKGKNE